LSKNLPNTDPFIEEVLNNFFTEIEAEEFNKNYLSDSSASELVAKLDDQSLKKQFDIDLNRGFKHRSQVDLLITFAENKLDQEKIIDLLLYLGQSTITSGEFATSLDIYEKLVHSTKKIPELRNITANVYLRIGEIYSRQAQWELSISYIEKADRIFKEENDVKGNAECENLMGTIYGDKGELSKAVEHFENTLTILEDNPDTSLEGKVEINLGIINNIQSNYDTALSNFRRALVNFEKVANVQRVAEVRQNMGMVYTKKKEYQSAISEFEFAMQTAMIVNYLSSIAITFSSKSYVYTKLGDYNLADAFAEKSMEVAYRLNDKLTIAEVYKVKGIIQRNKANFSTAESYLLTSLRLNDELGNQLNGAESSYELGILYNLMDDEEKSRRYFSDALEYYKKIKAEEEINEIEDLLKN
jgi:tetratricopeptide (TPR) repeat protein